MPGTPIYRADEVTRPASATMMMVVMMVVMVVPAPTPSVSVGPGRVLECLRSTRQVGGCRGRATEAKKRQAKQGHQGHSHGSVPLVIDAPPASDTAASAPLLVEPGARIKTSSKTYRSGGCLSRVCSVPAGGSRREPDASTRTCVASSFRDGLPIDGFGYCREARARTSQMVGYDGL